MKKVEEMSWQERYEMSTRQGYHYLLAAKRCFELAEVAHAKSLQDTRRAPSKED